MGKLWRLRVLIAVCNRLIVLIVVYNFFDRLVPPASLSPFLIAVILPIVIFGSMIAANLFAYFAGSAVTIPIVIQQMVAPLRPVRVRTALAAFKRRWWAFAVTSLIITGLTLLGAVFFILPGIAIAICYILYTPVVMMERLGIGATLKRARRLMKRSWTTVMLITVLQFVLPILVWIAAVNTSLTLKLNDDFSPKEFSFNFSMSGRSALFQLLNILVTPLTAIMTALLYLKARQSGGESLQDAVEQFDALEITRSRWQARMRSRALSRSAAPQGRETDQ